MIGRWLNFGTRMKHAILSKWYWTALFCALMAALVFAATFLLGLLGGLPRFVLLVFPFVRYVMFTVLVTVGLRYLRARKRK